MANNWTEADEAKSAPAVEAYQPTPYEKSPRELRIQKHITRLQAADEMLADGQISQVERDNIRTRMLQVIEDPDA